MDLLRDSHTGVAWPCHLPSVWDGATAHHIEGEVGAFKVTFVTPLKAKWCGYVVHCLEGAVTAGKGTVNASIDVAGRDIFIHHLDWEAVADEEITTKPLELTPLSITLTGWCGVPGSISQGGVGWP